MAAAKKSRAELAGRGLPYLEAALVAARKAADDRGTLTSIEIATIAKSFVDVVARLVDHGFANTAWTTIVDDLEHGADAFGDRNYPADFTKPDKSTNELDREGLLEGASRYAQLIAARRHPVADGDALRSIFIDGDPSAHEEFGPSLESGHGEGVGWAMDHMNDAMMNLANGSRDDRTLSRVVMARGQLELAYSIPSAQRMCFLAWVSREVIAETEAVH